MKTSSYMPKKEYRLLRSLYDLADEGVCCICYREYFEKNEGKFGKCEPWSIHTINSYHKLAVGNWCRLFGSCNEPTHYSKILQHDILKKQLENISNKDELEKKLLEQSGISDLDFEKYREKTVEYRNRYMTHRENSPEKINEGDLHHPYLGVAKATFLSSLLIIINLVKKFPKEKRKINTCEFIYDCVDNKEKIIDLIEETFPKFDIQK